MPPKPTHTSSRRKRSRRGSSSEEDDIYGVSDPESTAQTRGKKASLRGSLRRSADPRPQERHSVTFSDVTSDIAPSRQATVEDAPESDSDTNYTEHVPQVTTRQPHNPNAGRRDEPSTPHHSSQAKFQFADATSEARGERLAAIAREERQRRRETRPQSNRLEERLVDGPEYEVVDRPGVYQLQSKQLLEGDVEAISRPKAFRRLTNTPEHSSVSKETQDGILSCLNALGDIAQPQIPIRYVDTSAKGPSAMERLAPKKVKKTQMIKYKHHEKYPAEISDIFQPNDLKLVSHCPIDPEDPSGDMFFEHFIADLFSDIGIFIDTYFCPIPPDGFPDCADENNPWSGDMTPQFVKYAKKVAQEDPHSGGWGRIIGNHNQRKWLLIGILVQVLNDLVFDELLFGSHDFQKEMLVSMEKGLAINDGYGRTSLRAHTAKTILDDRTITDNFYGDIGMVTVKILALLNPLNVFIRTLQPRFTKYGGSSTTSPPLKSMNELHQDLNDIVAKSAYINLHMRLSPHIFHFYFAIPGEDYDSDLHWNVDDLSYTQSKDNVRRFLCTVGLSGNLHARTSGRQGAPIPAFKAKIKMACWPNIKIYKAGNGLEGGERKGFREIVVSKAGILAYWGIARQRDIAKAYCNVPLGTYLRDKWNWKDKQTLAVSTKTGLPGITQGVRSLLGWFYDGNESAVGQQSH